MRLIKTFILKYQYEINSIEEKQLLSFDINHEKYNNFLNEKAIMSDERT